MKINRYKKVHKILQFYCNNYGFRKPYQVLLDGTLCFAALKNKVNIQEQFMKYLDGEVKLLTTPCIVLEVEKLGPELFGVNLIIKKFASHQCGHSKSPVSGSQCILHMINDNNRTRYIVATQDRELQNKCRQIKGVPLMYLHMKTPTLEPPSDVTLSSANQMSSSMFNVSKLDEKKLSALNEKAETGTSQEFPKKRKRKGGPNPLSCKKKKTSVPETETSKKNEKTKRRKRNRSRLVQKIKKELVASGS